MGRTQSGKILGSNKRFISLVRQPSEEVVILRTSQKENMILIYGESGSSRNFCETEGSNRNTCFSSREVRTRASVQLDSGSFLMLEL